MSCSSAAARGLLRFRAARSTRRWASCPAWRSNRYSVDSLALTGLCRPGGARSGWVAGLCIHRCCEHSKGSLAFGRAEFVGRAVVNALISLAQSARDPCGASRAAAGRAEPATRAAPGWPRAARLRWRQGAAAAAQKASRHWTNWCSNRPPGWHMRRPCPIEACSHEPALTCSQRHVQLFGHRFQRAHAALPGLAQCLGRAGRGLCAGATYAGSTRIYREGNLINLPFVGSIPDSPACAIRCTTAPRWPLRRTAAIGQTQAGPCRTRGSGNRG